MLSQGYQGSMEIEFFSDGSEGPIGQPPKAKTNLSGFLWDFNADSFAIGRNNGSVEFIDSQGYEYDLWGSILFSSQGVDLKNTIINTISIEDPRISFSQGRWWIDVWNVDTSLDKLLGEIQKGASNISDFLYSSASVIESQGCNVTGSAGNDFIQAENTADSGWEKTFKVKAMAGDDIIHHSGGSAKLNGGKGDDVFVVDADFYYGSKSIIQGAKSGDRVYIDVEAKMVSSGKGYSFFDSRGSEFLFLKGTSLEEQGLAEYRLPDGPAKEYLLFA